MSLRIFHIIFIIASLICCLFFGVWSVRFAAVTGSAGYWTLGAGAAVVSLVLGLYSIFFYRKIHV